MDAVAQIKLAADMKRTGHLPDSVALWAVANPVAADQDTELKRCVTYYIKYCPMCTSYLPLCLHLCQLALNALHVKTHCSLYTVLQQSVMRFGIMQR
jgi:hypothetical protein